MKFRRVATLCLVPLAMQLSALSTPAFAAPSAFERAMLAELDDATRAEVTSRATDGNTVVGVVGTILLNHYQERGPRNPGEALQVVAVDFGRGVAVIQRAPNTFELIRFDPRTLQLR